MIAKRDFQHWPWPRIEFGQPALDPLQPPESRVFSRSRRVRQISYCRLLRISSRLLVHVIHIVHTRYHTYTYRGDHAVHVLELATRSSNGLVWQELRLSEWRFVEKDTVAVAKTSDS